VIVSRLTGEKVNDYLEPRLFTPLGIESHEWAESPQGYNAGGWGMYITTESLAKMSLFVLQKALEAYPGRTV
jgi:CubicO group peptidase (beta-lactamase class C family)